MELGPYILVGWGRDDQKEYDAIWQRRWQKLVDLKIAWAGEVDFCILPIACDIVLGISPYSDDLEFIVMLSDPEGDAKDLDKLLPAIANIKGEGDLLIRRPCAS